MNIKLASVCARLWFVGFLGMWVARGVFDRGPGELAFDVCARVCGIGGLTYVMLALLCLAGEAEEERAEA